MVQSRTAHDTYSRDTCHILAWHMGQIPISHGTYSHGMVHARMACGKYSRGTWYLTAGHMAHNSTEHGTYSRGTYSYGT